MEGKVLGFAWIFAPLKGAFFQVPARLGKNKTPSGRSLFGFGDRTNKKLHRDETMVSCIDSVKLSLLTYLYFGKNTALPDFDFLPPLCSRSTNVNPPKWDLPKNGIFSQDWNSRLKKKTDSLSQVLKLAGIAQTDSLSQVPCFASLGSPSDALAAHRLRHSHTQQFFYSQQFTLLHI